MHDGGMHRCFKLGVRNGTSSWVARGLGANNTSSAGKVDISSDRLNEEKTLKNP